MKTSNITSKNHNWNLWQYILLVFEEIRLQHVKEMADSKELKENNKKDEAGKDASDYTRNYWI